MLVLFVLSGSGCGRIAPPSPPFASPASATDTLVAGTPVERGRAIYLTGESLTRRPITARIGDGLPVPARSLACLQCHGADGRGRPEGGIIPSNITWPTLTRPYGATSPGRRRHPPYTQPLFGRAVTMGWDPAGQTLSTAMPRYQIAPEDLADLTTYIQQLDQVADPGISQTLIRLGLTFPPDKSDGLATRAIHAPIASYVESLNRAGGIFRRRLELIPLDAGAVDGVPGASAAPSSGIFAALGGLSPDGDAASDSVDAADIPSVRVFPSPTSVGPTSPRKTFALLSGHAGQARALAAFAERHRIGFAARIAVVHGASAAGRALSAAIARQLRDAGANDVRVDALAAPDVDDPSSLELAHRLLERGTAAVLFVGPADPAGLGAFLSAIAERDARLILLVPAALLDAAPVDLPQPASLAGRLVVARPIVPEASLNRPGDVLSPADRGQLALFALKILVEGLKEAGRDLDRDSLQKALERFSSPPIGPIPSISFGPGRRVGRRGACILRLSRDARTFAVDTAWIDPGSSTDHWPAEAGERP